MKLIDIFMRFGKSRYISNDKDIPKDYFKNIHPKQIIYCFDSLHVRFMMFKVEYSYTTIRGNKKQGEKYLVFQTSNPQQDIKEEFNREINKFNESNPNRKLLNVKILKSECLGYTQLK